MRRILLAGATILMATGMPGSVSAQTITYTVDCSKGQTISSAIARGDASKPLVIVVRGTCNEYVAILRDDVALRGEPGVGGAVNGPGSAAPAILVEGDRAYIEGLTVTGGANGVMFAGPVLASMTNVVVRNPASGHAVVARGGGDVSLSGCTLMQANRGLQIARGGAVRVTGNTEIRDNTDSGIFVDSNSTLVVSGSSKILANGGNGIDLENGSQGSIINSEIAGNTHGIVVSAAHANIGAGNNIHNNRGQGVLAVDGATAGVTDNTITHNNDGGVFGYLGSTLVLQGNEIAYNGAGVACRADCTMQISGANIHDNATHAVVVMLDSRAIFQAPMTTATPNGWVDLWCGDKKSSVDGVEGLSYDGGVFFTGSVSPSCVGFSD
jgi:parallel beta-helix repeat protein